LDSKAVKCVFIGYGAPTGIKGYRLYNPATKKIFTSRDVSFDEDSLLSTSVLTTPDDNSSLPWSSDNGGLYSVPTIPLVPPAIQNSEPSVPLVDLYQDDLKQDPPMNPPPPDHLDFPLNSPPSSTAHQ